MKKEEIQAILADNKRPIEERITRVDNLYADAVSTASDHDNEEFATLLSDYAQFLYDYARYPDAVRVYLRQIALAEKLYGEEHPNTATAYYNLGKTYFEQGNYKKALELFEKALAIREKTYGSNHADTAASYNGIGVIYVEQGDYTKALEYCNKALDIRQRVLGNDHIDTAKSYNNIGLVFFSKGDYDKALEYLFKALDITERNLGRINFTTATTYNNIGLIFKKKGDNDKAIENYYIALEIAKELFGQNHPDIADYYNNIGEIFFSQGIYDRALEYIQRALEINRQVLGENHPDTATTYNNIGLIFKMQGKIDSAISNYNRALDIRKRVLGADHLDTAESFNNMGEVCSLQSKYDEAIGFFQKALSIYENKLGKYHPQTAVVYSNIGKSYNKIGAKEKALEYYNKSLPVIEEKLGVVDATKSTTEQTALNDQNYYQIINDFTKCTAALNDANAFQRELQTIANHLREMFDSEYCAIGIVDGNTAEDSIVSIEFHDGEELKMKQIESLNSVRYVDISNKNILLCRALESKSERIITFGLEELKNSETYDHFLKNIMKSGNVFNNTVIPLRDDYNQNIGYVQFLNHQKDISIDTFSPYLTTFLSLTNTILQRVNKQKKENRENDFNFYRLLQKARSANELLEEIMKYLSREFNAAIVTFRIPLANAPRTKLSHFYLRGCYVNERIKNHKTVKKYYHKKRALIPIKGMNSYSSSRRVRKGEIIYKTVKDASFYEELHLDLYDKFISFPILRDDMSDSSVIKRLYGTFQLRFFKPLIISSIRFEKELDETKKRLKFLSEQITLLFNSYVHRFENESLQIFQKELRNSSFVKIQDFDARCVNIIKNSVRTKVCSIYRYDKQAKQLTLSATTAHSIYFKENNENLEANCNLDKCVVPMSFRKNLLVKAFEIKRPMYTYDILALRTHQYFFMENWSGKNHSAIMVPLIKKDGECLGVVLLIGKEDLRHSISTVYWDHDKSHIEYIVNTLTRISESDNERMTFLSQLSHELLTPVTEMAYDNDYTIDLARIAPNKVSKQMLITKLQENVNNCMLLKYIIGDTEFRYATSGRSMDYNIERQNHPRDVLLDAVRLLEKEAQYKEVSIHTMVSNMPQMYFDKERMMQVFLNLLKNAIRYSNRNTNVEIYYKQGQDGYHEIHFANYGIGVLENEREAIFELFYRGKEAVGKFVRGTGIGLYVVRDIMRAHGGDCYVKNLRNPTVFVITLPDNSNLT